MTKSLECTFSDGHSTYKVTFSSFFKGKCLYKSLQDVLPHARHSGSLLGC